MQIVIHVGHAVVINGEAVDVDWKELSFPIGISHLAIDTDKDEGQMQFENGLVMPITNKQLDVFKSAVAACDNAKSRKEAEMRDLRIKQSEETAAALAKAQKRKLEKIKEFADLKERVERLEAREKI